MNETCGLYKLWEDDSHHHDKFHTSHKQEPVKKTFLGLVKLYLWSQCTLSYTSVMQGCVFKKKKQDKKEGDIMCVYEKEMERVMSVRVCRVIYLCYISHFYS